VRIPVLRNAWLIGLLVLATGCAQAEPPRPLLWKISDADNHIYLLGSFHALKPADYPLAPSVDAAFADAEVVAFELPPEELNSPELAQKMLVAAQMPAGQTLQQKLSPSAWQELQRYCQAHALPLASFQGYEPWFVALLVGLNSLAQSGFDPELGLDRKLMQRAGDAQKPTLGLERSSDQIALFAGMSPIEQAETLDEALQDATDPAQVDRLHALWRAGDEKTLYVEMASDFRKKFPALYRQMDTERNDAWLPHLRAMLDSEHQRDTLVVVGSLHLLGDEGLVAKLQAAGYKVERVR
jgi:uncharacterized protein YbaP (TraB family)